MGSWYILPAHLEDKALLESNLSAWWGSRRMGSVETLPFVFLPIRSFRDLGAEYLTHKHQASKLDSLKKQAKLLGYELIPLAA